MCQVEDLIGKFGCKIVRRPGGAKLGIEDEGINWEFGINIYTLLNIKQINNRTYCVAQETILNSL